MVEEKARFELGMVKPDEILVQISTPSPDPRAGVAMTRPAASAAAAVRCPPSPPGARPSPGSSSSPSCSRWRWCCSTSASTRWAGRWPSSVRCSTSRCSGTAACTATRACRSSSRSSPLWGWWQWLRGTAADGAALRVTWLAARGPLGAAARAGAGLAGDRPLPAPYTDTDVPWWDAFPTAASVIGQWLLGRKHVENWAVWIVVNVVSVGAVRLQGPVADGAALRVVHRALGAGLARLARLAAAAMTRAFVIGIVGAESSGKTQLAQALAGAACRRGAGRPRWSARRCANSATAQRRTPRSDEQAAIAAEQTRRIEAAAAGHAAVVADTTALMTAVYSELVFGDTSLYAMAEQAHRRCDLTLLTALDLPWQADGLQRDGAHVREPVDALDPRRAAAHGAALRGGRRAAATRGCDRPGARCASRSHLAHAEAGAAQPGSGAASAAAKRPASATCCRRGCRARDGAPRTDLLASPHDAQACRRALR